MSKNTRYILLSLPSSVTPSGDRDDVLGAVRTTIGADAGSVSPFAVPEFKIGTLDALVQQADDLARAAGQCEGVVAKVGEALRSVLDGDDEQVARMKTVNDKPVDSYLRSFSWNKVKYRADKPLTELIDMLQKELASIDADVRGKFTQYNQVRGTLATLQRKQTGNLSTKSLASVVDPRVLVRDSEYLQTHLVAVPNRETRDFIQSYETLSPMVVPRSAALVAADDEYTLYAATTFKKHSLEFLHRCREHKWQPRDFNYVEGGGEAERAEVDRVGANARRLWGDTLRLARTGWGEAVMVWVHIYVLRVFVETVLRYGLPLDYVASLVKTTNKQAPKVKAALDSAYSYLAGNAFARDKKGRVRKDDPAELGHADNGDFTAFVYYELEVQ